MAFNLGTLTPEDIFARPGTAYKPGPDDAKYDLTWCVAGKDGNVKYYADGRTREVEPPKGSKGRRKRTGQRRLARRKG